METILEMLQEEFSLALDLTRNSVHRHYKFPISKNIIKMAIGIRRTGKTYFLFQTARQLIREGIPLSDIIHQF